MRTASLTSSVESRATKVWWLVRARKEGGLLTPREAVDIRKQRQVVETARRLLPRRGFHDVLRFDVVGVYLNDRDEPIRAEHFESAFDPGVLRRR